MSVLDDILAHSHRTVGKVGEPVPEHAKAGLTDVADGMRALTIFVERTRDGILKDKPVRCDGEKVKGFAALITLESRTMMQGCTIGGSDIKNYVVSLLTLLYSNMKESDFHQFLLELPRHVVTAEGSKAIHEETKQ